MVNPGNVDDREPLKNKTFVEQMFGKLVEDKLNGLNQKKTGLFSCLSFS